MSIGFLKLAGQQTGPIKGSATQLGYEDTILVSAVTHQIGVPTGGPPGVAAWKRQHRPIIITKDVDEASPPLHGVLARNEPLKDWELQLVRPVAPGQDSHYFTIRLTKASIASVTFHLPNAKDPAFAKTEAYEEVAFVYHKIEWFWVDGGISASDAWASVV